MTIPNPHLTSYLGDSVYITNGFGTSGFLEIFTCNGAHRENIIYLEMGVAVELVKYLNSILLPPIDPKSDVDI